MFNPEMKLNLEGKKMATRDGVGKGLVELGERDPNLWVLTADVAESTRVHWFAEKFPKRFVQVGVAEQNMASVAAGISACNKTAVISSFGAFSPGRNWDQIRVSICYNDVKVIIHASHTGITVGPDGASHQILEDIALMRSLPNMTVVVPADGEEARKAVIEAHKRKEPVYIRTGREKIPTFTTEETPFEIGKANLLKDGSDIAIFACGVEVYHSIIAAKMLKEKGIDAAVINMHTIKPIDKEMIIKWAKKCPILTVEEHQVHGGMGSAISEVVVQNHPTIMKIHGIYDRFGESGTAEELLRKYKLDANGIVESAEELLKKVRK